MMKHGPRKATLQITTGFHGPPLNFPWDAKESWDNFKVVLIYLEWSFLLYSWIIFHLSHHKVGNWVAKSNNQTTGFRTVYPIFHGIFIPWTYVVAKSNITEFDWFPWKCKATFQKHYILWDSMVRSLWIPSKMKRRFNWVARNMNFIHIF